MLDLAVAYAFPPHSHEFTLQVLELTHIWSGSDSDVTELDDILAVAAAVYNVHQTASFTALTRQQPGDVSVLHNAHTIQRVAHVQLRMLEQLGYELATLTPMAWVDISANRQSLLILLLSLLIRLPQPTFRFSHSVSLPQPAKLALQLG